MLTQCHGFEGSETILCDSLVVDSEVEQKIRLQEVASGILSPEAYLEWRYGATGAQVEDLMPKPDESFDDVAEEE